MPSPTHRSETVPPYEELEPRAVWRHFAELSRIPRCSKNEDAARRWILDLARDHELDAETDAAGNVIVGVPPSAGQGEAPSVILQAHLDMVCEKNEGTDHDFGSDPIRLRVEMDEDGPVVTADGTTLGADNGIGVALALAAALDPDQVRPRLELLFTVDEEDGMSGAKGVDPSRLEGRTLLNLDTPEESTLTIGCAGGCDSELTWSLDTESATGRSLLGVEVRGLRGGHSGGDIHEGRGAATKILARVLDRARSGEHDLRIARLHGGSKRNAIPREASAVVEAKEDALRRAAAEIQAVARAESREPGLEIRVTPAPPTSTVLGQVTSARVLDALLALPHGVLQLHPEIDGLVETSNNLALLRTEEEGDAKVLRAVCMSRSSSDSRMDEALARTAAVARLSGAEVETRNRYSGWEPDLDSPVVQLCRDVHRRLFDREARAEAVHGGLECGILGRRIPGLDMVSLGPRIEALHSPDERVWQPSVERTRRYLGALLEELATARRTA